MRESIQHKLDVVRPPRVHITYDVELAGATTSRELPYVLGIIVDLSGMSEVEKPLLKDRKFIDMTSDNFNDIMKSISPQLKATIKNKVGDAKAPLDLNLTFSSMDDFGPINLVLQVPEMKNLHDSRVRLNDLLSKLDGNEVLNKSLDGVISGETKDTDAGHLIKEANLIRDPSQTENTKAIINEFLELTKAEKKPSGSAIAVVTQRIAELDQTLSNQLNELLHNPAFQKIEATWRGLDFLLRNTSQSSRLKIRVLNISRQELQYDLEKAMEFDQSQLFKKVYEEEYGTFGGSPFSILMSEIEFGRAPEDIELLTKISQVAAAAHAPFVAAASPTLFDLDSFNDLGHPRDLSRIFDNTELGKWNSFRESEDSRYVALTLPHVLMRAPYGNNGTMIYGMDFQEDIDGIDNSKFCWGSPAWALAQRVLNSAALYSWPAAIRGVESGGLVEDLPYYSFKTTDGDVALKCPTEVAITDRREKELSELGFMALCHCKNHDYAAFFSSQTAQKNKLYNLDQANANARLSTRLTYMLAASRFAHYIKVLMRDKIGSFMSRRDIENYLNNWLASYVLLSDEAGQIAKSRFPLREGKVTVVEVPGQPGSYRAVVFLRPHFQLEELTASIRLVATLPKSAV